MDQWAHAIRAVAFDMDGLMVNTEELYTIVGETILERRGRRFTTELKNSMTGLPGPAAWQMMIDSERLSDPIPALAAESEEIFRELLPTRLTALPGLFELLDYLDEHRFPRCVATSSSHKFAAQVLALIGAESRFDFVITAEDVTRGKPAPDIYLAAAERMYVPAAQMLVLEDSHHGTRAGIAAGACTVAVPGDHSRSHDFSGVHQRASSLVDPQIRNLLKTA